MNIRQQVAAHRSTLSAQAAYRDEYHYLGMKQLLGHPSPFDRLDPAKCATYKRLAVGNLYRHTQDWVSSMLLMDDPQVQKDDPSGLINLNYWQDLDYDYLVDIMIPACVYTPDDFEDEKTTRQVLLWSLKIISSILRFSGFDVDVSDDKVQVTDRLYRTDMVIPRLDIKVRYEQLPLSDK